MFSDKNRLDAIAEDKAAFAPVVRRLTRDLGRERRHLDVGVWRWAGGLHAPQIEMSAIAAPGRNSTLVAFGVADACTLGFALQHKDQHDVVTSAFSFHEFADPMGAALNIFGIVPAGGVAIIIDRSQEGWERERRLVRNECGRANLHYGADLERLRLSGLGTDDGIRSFWQAGVFPQFGGICALEFHQNIYCATYRNTGTAQTAKAA